MVNSNKKIYYSSFMYKQVEVIIRPTKRELEENPTLRASHIHLVGYQIDPYHTKLVTVKAHYWSDEHIDDMKCDIMALIDRCDHIRKSLACWNNIDVDDGEEYDKAEQAYQEDWKAYCDYVEQVNHKYPVVLDISEICKSTVKAMELDLPE